MAVYRVELEGRKEPILLRAKSKTEAIETVVTAKALTGEEVEEAFSAGMKLWTPGTPLPVHESELQTLDELDPPPALDEPGKEPVADAGKGRDK